MIPNPDSYELTTKQKVLLGHGIAYLTIAVVGLGAGII